MGDKGTVKSVEQPEMSNFMFGSRHIDTTYQRETILCEIMRFLLEKETNAAYYELDICRISISAVKVCVSLHTSHSPQAGVRQLVVTALGSIKRSDLRTSLLIAQKP